MAYDKGHCFVVWAIIIIAPVMLGGCTVPEPRVLIYPAHESGAINMQHNNFTYQTLATDANRPGDPMGERARMIDMDQRITAADICTNDSFVVLQRQVKPRPITQGGGPGLYDINYLIACTAP